jgi:hypothetical protein
VDTGRVWIRAGCGAYPIEVWSGNSWVVMCDVCLTHMLGVPALALGEQVEMVHMGRDDVVGGQATAEFPGDPSWPAPTLAKTIVMRVKPTSGIFRLQTV